MELKKIIFYVIFLLLLLVFQLYFAPYFLLFGLIILVWLGWKAKEVCFFIIASLILDIFSSFPFGIHFFFFLILFLVSSWILKAFFREWTLITFLAWFLLWQIIYLLLWWSLAGNFSDFIMALKILCFDALFAIIFFVFLNYLKALLESQNLVALEKITPTEF